MIKNIIFILLIIFIGSIDVSAQRYRTAAGLRLGSPFGLTVQQVVWGQNTLEGILTFNPKKNESAVTLLFENHRKIFSKRFNISHF